MDYCKLTSFMDYLRIKKIIFNINTKKHSTYFMKILVSILLFFSTLNFVSSQTKKDLIEGIIEVNSFDDWDGIENSKCFNNIICKNNNHYNFEKLKKIISTKELIKLSKHKNPVMKMYAVTELMFKNQNSIDLKGIILDEINKNQKIATESGCIVDKEYTYSILYHRFYSGERDENNVRLTDINKAIIKIDRDLEWTVYYRIFSNIVYDKDLKNSIINLLYKYNNSYAFEYLRKNYPEDFEQISTHYFNTIFPKQNFEEVNQTFYLFNLAEHAFEKDDKKMKDKIIEKLRTTKGWEKELSGLFRRNIFEKYNVKL